MEIYVQKSTQKFNRKNVLLKFGFEIFIKISMISEIYVRNKGNFKVWTFTLNFIKICKFTSKNDVGN